MSTFARKRSPGLFESHLSRHYVARALRPFKRAKAFRVFVILPPGCQSSTWYAAAHDIMTELFPTDRVASQDWEVGLVQNGSIVLSECTSSHPRLLVLVDADCAAKIDDALRVGADAVVSIDAISGEIVRRVAKLRCNLDLAIETAQTLAAMPPGERNFFLRQGANVNTVIARLPISSHETVAPIEARDMPVGPRLEELHGYGSAKDWGLQLAQDLADFKSGVLSWDDLDRGLLISGPPGCGKTTFATALANSCGVNLELASYARWYDGGSGQGDLVKAMRTSFAEAVKHAPSILFIDEIDSFGDRDRQPDWHAEWSRQVINALLECMDGASSREGVVVIGACNNPVVIDPAIRRSGRLDRHIRISLPDNEARGAILCSHLKSDVDTSAIIPRTEGMSGADLERIAREARRIARRERRPVSSHDVLMALPERRPHAPEHLHNVAVHEAGHAVAGIVLGVSTLSHVEISPTFDPMARVQSAGLAQWELNPKTRRDRRHYEDVIAMTLAGMAAETIVFQEHSDGVSADLDQATYLAARMIGAFGMVGRLVSVGDIDADQITRLVRQDAEFSEAIDRVLQAQRDRALDIVEANRAVIEQVADCLYQNHRIEGSVITEMVQQSRCDQRIAVGR